jgi:Cu(I)/Ag(I) efflux system membrane fusion protein
MKQATIVITLVATFAGGAALGLWLAERRNSLTAGAAHEGHASQPDATRKILYWYDPMQPGVKFDQPGQSPFMDMPLVPRYADEEGSAAVRVDPATAQNLGIRTAKVEKATVTPRLTAVGSVAFDERLLRVVQARVAGYVTRLHANTPLETVRRGQPLAEILAPEWRAAQEEYLALLDADFEQARSIRDAARERLVVLGVPDAVIRRIEATRTVEATTTIAAPIDGIITELAVREGAAFAPGAPLFRINGLATVWADARVPEARISEIPPESSVEARTAAWPGMRFTGRISALLPDVDLQTRTLAVRIAIDNSERKLAPGMFLSLDFAGTPGKPQLVVPSEALIVTGERSVVIVARDGGGFDVPEVTAGLEADGKTVILSGLEEGQSVVVSGQFLIDSEASLNAAITRLGTPESRPEKSP